MKGRKESYKPSPVMVVMTTTVVVMLGILLLGRLSAGRHHVKARVEIADPVIEAGAGTGQRLSSGPVLPDGEAERLAVRVREVSALVMGLTVLSLDGQMNRREVTSVEALLDLMAGRSLLPPGVRKHPAPGVLESERAVIYVRYRPEPLGVEVVSAGRERLDGPALIGRLATGGDDSSGAVLLVAGTLGDAPVPAPFAPLAQVRAMNWGVERLRERAFDPREVEALETWVRGMGAGGQVERGAAR
jgi:hypothetical protein